MEKETTFDSDLIHAIFKHIWTRRSLERERNGGTDAMESEFLLDQAGAGTSKKNRPTSANANALKLSCELLRVFVTAAIAEAEGVSKIEATHLERILPQLLLDF
ncbi:protein MHF2-like [Citrus sinensis]|nr:protein MHF2-like [Citrus sinensis]